MPIHHDVAAIIRSDPKCVAGYAVYEQYLADNGIASPWYMPSFSLDDCGIPEKGLRDHTHLNQLGATIYCRHLGARVREQMQGGK